MFVEQVKRKKGTVIARRGASSSPPFSGSKGSRVHLLCPGSAPWEAAGQKRNTAGLVPRGRWAYGKMKESEPKGSPTLREDPTLKDSTTRPRGSCSRGWVIA